jgi:uncharacterized protein Yka (UPF0111/DUF47 family)
MGFLKLLPREEQYFSLFAQMTSYINDAANSLVEMLAHGDGDYQEYVQRIKSIEHARRPDSQRCDTAEPIVHHAVRPRGHQYDVKGA